MTRNGMVTKRIPKDQVTLSGIDVIQARTRYSLSRIPNMRVFCLFCFHVGNVRDFAQIDFMGELENLFKCPECNIRMTRQTLMNKFTAEQLGFFIGYYDRFWSRVSNHEEWNLRFKRLFTYEERQQFWNAYYKIRPKKEHRVEDNR